ncbi:MAG: putative rane protein [Gemmatimonadetes bacterium]|nr:putative rane protein [Gemmatimonadota bacterium]
MTPDVRARIDSDATVLLSQRRLRTSVAAGAGLVWLALVGLWRSADASAQVAIIVGSYIAAVWAIGFWVSHVQRTRGWSVAATVLADLALIFALALALSPPSYYDRILIFSFFVLHLTEFYFGRSYSMMAVLMVIACYLVVVASAIAQGAPLVWGEELWSLAVFAIAAAVFVFELGNRRSRLYGIVGLFERAEEGDFTQEYDVDSDKRSDAITAVGSAYNRVRSQLASMVLTDPLTGCLNRRGFDQALAREVSRASRAKSELSMLALDLDHFKRVNDTLGHMAGDDVLRRIGELLLQTARGGDVVARTGGEEFSILLPDTGAAGAYMLATRLCETVRERPFQAGSEQVGITVSIGVVSATPGLVPPTSAEELARRADEALYGAKRGGRDRTRVWTEDESQPRPSVELRGLRWE